MWVTMSSAGELSPRSSLALLSSMTPATARRPRRLAASHRLNLVNGRSSGTAQMPCTRAPAWPPDAKPGGYLAGGPVARRGEVDQRAELCDGVRDGVGEAALERVGCRARRSRAAVAAAAAEVNREWKK